MGLNVKAYLNRLGLSKPPSATLTGLKTLHRRHLYSVPFENLDICSGTKIVLEIKALEHKIINKKRGGFCYELNGLFCQLLKQLGFQVKMISAQVYSSTGELGPEFDHMALVVTFDDGQWLADVGFGDNFVEPLALVTDIEQTDPAGCFKMSGQNDHQLTMSRKNIANQFSPQILFSLEEYKLEDFNNMCGYHQTSAESNFTKSKICSLATREGRVTLSADRLIETVNDKKSIRSLNSDSDTNKILQTYFHIEL